VIAESFGVDYMECASSFLISMCRSNLWAFHQDGLHEAAMLKTGPGDSGRNQPRPAGQAFRPARKRAASRA
jgi:hypothetical protein